MAMTSDVLQRATTRIRFRHTDMDFNFNWVLGVADLFGLAHGEAFFIADAIRDGDGESWRKAFTGHGLGLKARVAGNASLESGHAMLGACYAFRAALFYSEPGSSAQADLYELMEHAFAKAISRLRIPVRSVSIAHRGATLPGYFLEIDDQQRPTLLMIGGGDTCREDLFAFAGFPGWRRDYNVLMVDLPGQGRTPAAGLSFETRPEEAIADAIDWLHANASAAAGPIAIYGVSGGGYFTARAVAHDPRINAWIASTPIFDIAAVFWIGVWALPSATSSPDVDPPAGERGT